jgi:SAM-dependent methyltransferase
MIELLSDQPATLDLKVSNYVGERLCCPVCRGKLLSKEDSLRCTDCGTNFPVINGIPVLINDANSVFSITDFTKQLAQPPRARRGLFSVLEKFVPQISLNVHSDDNYGKFLSLIEERGQHCVVLIVGGGAVGKGMVKVLEHPLVELIETDVYFGPRTAMICDGHDLPFADKTFDCAIIQAVLEHVADPSRCVEEIFRVLKPKGVVYAETPFMQQVHEGRYDFTRFTPLGHRRLFRNFEEVESGIVCGPGMALAWSYKYFLASFFQNHLLVMAASTFARFTAFWLKYFDYALVKRPGAYDAASGVYFLGTKADRTLADRDLVKQYRGLIGDKYR